MSEQRKEPRKNVKIAMQLFLFNETSMKVDASSQLEGNIRDISSNGVGIEMQINSDETWEILINFDEMTQERLFVHLDVFHPKKNIEILGTLIWCLVTDMKKRCVRMGILLNKMDTESLDEWYRFVFSIDALDTIL